MAWGVACGAWIGGSKGLVVYDVAARLQYTHPTRAES